MAEAKSKSTAKSTPKSKSKSAAKSKSKAAAKSQAKSQSKPKRGRKKKMELLPPPSLGEALGWVGSSVDDMDGGSLGKVAGIHVDAGSEQPAWVVVRLGMLTGHAAIPFEHVADAGPRLWSAYTKDEVRTSPRVEVDQELTRQNELQLCAHYGIREGVSRAGAVADREADEITAVPAED